MPNQGMNALISHPRGNGRRHRRRGDRWQYDRRYPDRYCRSSPTTARSAPSLPDLGDAGGQKRAADRCRPLGSHADCVPAYHVLIAIKLLRGIRSLTSRGPHASPGGEKSIGEAAKPQCCLHSTGENRWVPSLIDAPRGAKQSGIFYTLRLFGRALGGPRHGFTTACGGS